MVFQQKAQISPQFLNKSQITVTILDVVNPAHFVVKESPTLDASSEARNFLEAEEAMQKYYESVEPCFFQLPLKDSIIVVLYQKKFYRAKVIRILTQSTGHLFKVYLVDYGTECSVPRDCIYEIASDFLDHPFQAVDLKLLGIEPISLVMSTADLSMSYGAVTYWDPSAEIYVHDLQKGMCNAYIEVKAIDEQCVHGSLFICYNDNTVKCINNELVSNAFAHFDESCWERVHKIEYIRENNSTKDLLPDTSISEQINPKQMSNPGSLSKTEVEFRDLTTAFIRPSDGRVVAKSSFTKDVASDSLPEIGKDNVKEQLIRPSDGRIIAKSPVTKDASSDSLSEIPKDYERPQVQEKWKAISPAASEAISAEQKALNLTRFQKLQMLGRKRYSSNPQHNLQDAVSKSTSFAENTVLKENPSSNVTTDKRESNSFKLNITDSESIHKHSISASSNDINVDSKEPKAADKVCALPEIKSKQESVSKADAILSKKFQKLQELCRKRHSSHGPSNMQSTDSKKTSIVNNNLSMGALDKLETPTDYSNADVNLTDRNIIDTSNTSISSDSDNSKSASPQQLSSKDISCDATVTSSIKQDRVLENDQLITSKKFQKLQLLNRRKLLSPICQSFVNKNSSTAVETVPSEPESDKIDNTAIKLNASECEINNDTLTPNKPIPYDCHSIISNNLGSETAVPDKKVHTALEISPRQENKPQAIKESLSTFQKLQQRVRMKKMKQLVPASEKSTDDLKKIEENFKTKCSIDMHSENSSLILSNSAQLISSSSTNSLPEKSSSSDEKITPKSQQQEIVEFEKMKSLIEESKKFTQSSATTKETNITEGASGISHKNEMLSEIKLPEEGACNTLGEIKTSSIKESLSSSSLLQKAEEIKKSPLRISKGDLEVNDLDFSPKESKQSEILNELLAMSDSDDLLCSISKKKDEKFYDRGPVEGNYIELSTQLKHSDPKLIAFDELSLWEKQKIPALLIGIGLTQPVLSTEHAKFSNHIVQVLKEIKFYGPSCIQSVIWPCLEKNRCMVAVAPPHSGKTVSYVLPLVSSFTEGEVYTPHENGPSTIILCSSWLKAQAVYDLFHFFLGDKKMNIITLCTDGGHYRNKVVSLINSCDVLIATPYCLLQFLKNNSIKFEQLENFILDDSTALMNRHKKELKNILLSYIYTSKRNMITPQLMLFAERWNKNFHIILDKMMSNPLIFFTSFLESALFAKISIFAHVCPPEGKKETLLNIVQKAGKIVICTTNISDAVDVHHFLRCEDVRTFLVNEDMEHYIADEVIKDWKSIRCMATSHCLVITDQALIKMCISNATCLVHFDIPQESRLQFGNRFSCIAEHFQEANPTCVSHILITELDRCYAPQIVEIVQNSGATPSEELIELSKNQDQVESTLDLLCPYLKAFGFCRERLCKYRHIVNKEKDKPQIVPFEGDIQGLVTEIVDASHYYVRLLKYLDPASNKTVSLISTYAEIGFMLRDFYSHAHEEMKVKSPIVGEIYVLAEENNLFYRIKVLKAVDNHPTAVGPSWKVLFLDEGWIKYYQKLDLYKVSDQVKLPAPLAVEVYVCNVITPDSCFDWNPQTSQLVSDLIKGKEIHGKVALCLGKTLWLDPIALVLHLPNTNEYINLFKLNQKLLECGHARPNKNHLLTLRKACAGKIPLPQVARRAVKKEETVTEQMPEISYAFLECDTYEDVYVSSVISPHQFYIQRAKFVECLDNLLEKINERVEKRMLKKAFSVHKGLHCIAPFYEDDRYYRAVIIDVVSYTEVQLFYVDFGDTAKAPRNNIYCLPAEFLLLPFQAIECELAGIAAAHGGWTDSSVDALTTLTRDESGDMKIVQLKAYSKSSCYDGGNHYVVNIWFNEKSLSEQLLQAGFGVPSEVPIDESFATRPLDISSDHSSDEEFNLNEREPLPLEDSDGDDKEAAALFYNYVAEMVLQANNLIPKPGVTITEVSSDDEKCNNKLDETNKIDSEKMCNDLMKLLPKRDLGDKDGTQLEPCSNSVKPLITWWDTPDQLNVLIHVKDIKIYQLVVTDEGFNFNTIVAGIQHSTDETFYEKIHSSEARNYQTCLGINIVAKKQTPFKWPRFTKEKKKFFHIKYDLIHVDDSDTDEESASAKKESIRPEYAMDEDSSSTDEDEKYVEPWRDFAQQSSPFSKFD